VIMRSDEELPSGSGDPLPRQSIWAHIPKRSLSRVLLLLALLAGILYLRKQATTIAGCMSDAFRVPAAEPAGVRLKAPVVLPGPAPQRTPR
jgi:hypothetical protein